MAVHRSCPVVELESSVAIEREERRKPYLGGFRDKRTGVEYHHASTQRQALCAILFLYKRVLDIELGDLDIARARRKRRLPVR